jgi:hypothetical protein
LSGFPSSLYDYCAVRTFDILLCVYAIHLIDLTTYAVKPSSVVLKTTEDDSLGKINTQVTNIAVLFPVTWKIFFTWAV